MDEARFGTDEFREMREERHDVVLDPERRFGAPISNATGIATVVLSAAFRAERSYRKAAWWYQVPEHCVRDAVRFERRWQPAA